MAKIFILEDDPSRIDWFKKQFAEIDCTANVNEALNKIKNNSYDAIFLDRDISDPNMTGEDLAWEMSQKKLASDTPIIIHSENDRGQRVISRYLKTYHKKVSGIKFKDLKKMSSKDVDDLVKTEAEPKQMKESDNKQSQSVFDVFFNNNSGILHFNSYQQQKIDAAKTLFAIWQDDKNKISDKTFRKPINVSSNELNTMQKEGLVKCLGDRVEITSKGSEVIKTLILGDDRCSFDNGYEEPLDIITAETNIKKGKTLRKTQKQHEDQWWQRILR